MLNSMFLQIRHLFETSYRDISLTTLLSQRHPPASFSGQKAHSHKATSQNIISCLTRRSSSFLTASFHTPELIPRVNRRIHAIGMLMIVTPLQLLSAKVSVLDFHIRLAHRSLENLTHELLVLREINGRVIWIQEVDVQIHDTAFGWRFAWQIRERSWIRWV